MHLGLRKMELNPLYTKESRLVETQYIKREVIGKKRQLENFYIKGLAWKYSEGVA